MAPTNIAGSTLQKRKQMDDEELARKAFTAGYKARELKVRKETHIVEKVIERKFNTWWQGVDGDDNE